MLHDEIMDMIMDHYENPRNFGKLDDYDLVQNGGNQGCGDTLKLYIKFGDDGEKIDDISFTGDGCIISQASASVVIDKIKHEPVDTIADYDLERMKEYLGKDIVIRRPRCATLVIDTLKTAIKKYEYIRKSNDIQSRVG